MARVTIYHNPRCSKSRQSLALLEDNGAEVHVVPYLDEPPDASELKHIIRMLGVKAMDIVRTGESEFAESGIRDDSTEDDIISAIVSAPKLMQRPIVVSGEKAVIGRPPENVLELIGAS